MKKSILFLCLLIAGLPSFTQTVYKRLEGAYQKFEKDSQLSNAVASLYVINANTGEVVFDKNSRVGLATASTLKIITAATAYELLGKDFRYETKFGYAGTIKEGAISSGLILTGYGDPTLGSWRYNTTKPTTIFLNLKRAMEKLGIRKIFGPVTYT